ncbi:MAG: DUF4166 domain-containing protein [Pseudomonadota bacterium]
MDNRLRLLIVGGYGSFGGRIVELLEDDPRLTLIVAGRSLQRAQDLCGARASPKAELVPAAFDRDGDLAEELARWRPDVVIDASGPFQTYGEDRYRLVEAAIARGAHYLDLADSADFVMGISALEAKAKTADVHVLSGASSFPALSAAAVRHLARGMARIEAIRGGLAPSPYADLGSNVMRAIASYAGKPITVRRNGAATTAYPATEQLRFTIAPPGGVPLRSRLFSLVEVPDLLVLAGPWPKARDIWIGAAPVPELFHRIFIGAAWLVRWRVLGSLAALAPLIHRVSRLLRWGEHRSGMFMEVTGEDETGAPVTRAWHLTAEGDDGPFIAAMAVAALIRKTLEGRAPEPGARPATRDLDLADYERLFAGRAIRWGVRQAPLAKTAPLYERILGSAWSELPEEIRAMHAVETMALAEGRASVERGRGWLARLAGAVIGFPAAIADTPVRVRFDAENGIETWTRSFGAETFHSAQFAGTGRAQGLIQEKFGPLTFAMALVLKDGRLSLILRHWRAFGFPMPMFLCPRSTAHETVEEGRFRFHVEIGHPLTGLIVRYRGWLRPVTDRAP